MMNKYIIEMCCDCTIMIFVFQSKLNNDEIEKCFMHNDFDDLQINLYDEKLYNETINFYKYDNDCECTKHIKTSNFEMIIFE